MKKSLKRFVKLSWRGIPIGIIASVLIGTAVLAAATYLIIATQTITQEIKEPYVPPAPDYGEIHAPDIDLSNVKPNSSFSQTLTGAVIVELGPDGVGKGLKLVCEADPLYDSFDVTLFLKVRPEGSEVDLYGYGISGGGAAVTIQLDKAGTYIFDQTIKGIAGSTPGPAESIITLTLEDTFFPPGP